MVTYNNKSYYINILETKPASAVSIIETDCEVDFAPPLDYKEPEKPQQVSTTTSKGLTPVLVLMIPRVFLFDSLSLSLKISFSQRVS